MTLKNVKTEFQIEFENPQDAKIIWKALKPETVINPSGRSSTKIKLLNKTLIIHVNAADATSLRAAINSYLRWIILSYDVIKLKG
jgi:KEOPS complex subunit Pcc1